MVHIVCPERDAGLVSRGTYDITSNATRVAFDSFVGQAIQELENKVS